MIVCVDAAERQPARTDASDAEQVASAAPSAEVQPKQGTKVSQKKVDQVKVCQHLNGGDTVCHVMILPSVPRGMSQASCETCVCVV